MRLMNNSYLKMDTILTSLGEVVNSTDLILLPKIPEKFLGKDYILYKKIEDDSLLEKISYDIYGTTDFWDILMVLNGITRTNQLPTKYDTIQEYAEYDYQNWLEKMYKILNIEVDVYKEAKYQEILNDYMEKNEKFRNFKYISPTDMSELLADLNNLKQEPNINSNLIINKD